MGVEPAHSDPRIGIIALGWLGKAVAVQLQKKGYWVVGTSATQSVPLRNAGLNAFPWRCGQELPEELLTCTHLIINLPPGKTNPLNYPQAIESILKQLSKEVQVLMISSTGVYRDENQNISEKDTDQWINEEHPVWQAEQILRSWAPHQQRILRLAGLYGPDRLPARYFSNKKDIPAGLNPVNLIHQEDAVNMAIISLLESEAGVIWHGCAPSHPNRMDCYTRHCLEANLPAPHFLAEKTQWKTIDSSLSSAIFSFHYQHLP